MDFTQIINSYAKTTNLENRNFWLPSFLIFKILVMTKLGEILSTKSIKKSEVSKKTGISTSRLSQLSRNDATNLKAEELFLIALAINVSPIEILLKVCSHLNLQNE